MKVIVKRVLVYVIILAISGLVTTQVMAESKFTDIKGNCYEEDINRWIDRDYINGYHDGTFRPNNPITRAEIMVLINKSMNINEIEEINFLDVSEKDWYYGDVQKAYKKRYMKGIDNKMLPNDNLTRQELAVILSRLANLDTVIDNEVFSKIIDANQISEWSKVAVNATLKKNFFEGFVKDEFRPFEKVSRIEALVVIDRLIKDLTEIIQEEVVPIGAPIVTKYRRSNNRNNNDNEDNEDNDTPIIPVTLPYSNFEELSANEKENIDYKITSVNKENDMTIFTINGGGIEKGLSKIVKALSKKSDYNYYIFEGVKSDGNYSLHITSTNFNEPIAIEQIQSSKNNVSFIGIKDDGDTVYIGGQNKVLARILNLHLQKAGFDVKYSSEVPLRIAGIKDANIVNSSSIINIGGVQISISRGIRDKLASDTTKFNLFIENIDDALSKTWPEIFLIVEEILKK